MVRIGTSGWNYKHWKNIFYPEGTPQRKWLEYYSKKMDTVEVNATFYRLPSKSTFEGWKNRTPEGFVWSVKAPREITHRRRLKDVEKPLKEFLERADVLGNKLGPVLFQLPPGLKLDMPLAVDFFEQIKSIRFPVIEARNKSWFNDNLFDMLKSYSIALCISHSSGRFPFMESITSDFIYIRLHGPGKLYASSYSDDELNMWARKIIKWNKPTFVYFNNDFNGYAIENATELKRLISSILQEHGHISS